MLHHRLPGMNVQLDSVLLYAVHQELLGYPQHQVFREQCTYIFFNFEK